MVGGGYVGGIMGAVMKAIWPIQTKPGSLACNLSAWRPYLGLMHFLWKRCSLVVMPQAAPHLAHAAKVWSSIYRL